MYMAERETKRRLKLPACGVYLVRPRPLADCHVAGTYCQLWFVQSFTPRIQEKIGGI